MARQLISFLGRTARSSVGDRRDYRRTRYRFSEPDGTDRTSGEVTMFFKAVFSHLTESQQRPDRVLLFGTSGSMWDALLDEFPPDLTESEKVVAFDQLLVELRTAVDERQVDQAFLDRLTSFLSEGLATHVKLILIGEALAPTEQVSILTTILDHVSTGDRLWIDVTHGYRHLPMLGMTSAVLAGSARKARIEDIVYGALEMTCDGAAPVVSLMTLMNTISWAGSLEQYSLTGRIRSLLAMLPRGDLHESLDRIEFLVSTNQIGAAAKNAREVLSKGQWERRLSDLPIWPLLEHPMKEMLKEVARANRTVDGLCLLAETALREKDLVRALLLISEAGKEFESNSGKDMPLSVRKAKAIRNLIAHPPQTQNPKAWSAKVLSSRGKLNTCLRTAIGDLRHANGDLSNGTQSSPQST